MEKHTFVSMIKRVKELIAREILEDFPVLGLIGPRQIGKTTLAKLLMQEFSDAIYLDLESPTDAIILENAEQFFLENADKLIVIDEVQRNKTLFPIIRSVVDKNRKPARFILLGSASPELIRDSSESLAGRIAYLEIAGFNLLEQNELDSLWLNGGFPQAFLKPTRKHLWFENYIKTYVERDLPMLGFPADPGLSRRLWTMLAHYHGQTINYTELARNLEITAKTVKTYLAFLEDAFLIHLLPSNQLNIKKRLVKAPKVYVRDAGIFHHLLGIETKNELLAHPKLGASWEGFVVEQIHQLLPTNRTLAFYRTHQGAELDVLILRAGLPVAGIEIKFGDNVRISKGNTEAVNDFEGIKKYVITKNSRTFTTKEGFQVMNIQDFLKDVLPTI